MGEITPLATENGMIWQGDGGFFYTYSFNVNLAMLEVDGE